MDGSLPWGHPSRYYSSPIGGSVPSLEELSFHAEGRLLAQLEAAAPEAREIVKRAVSQWNSAVRDALRGRTGFRLSSPKQASPGPEAGPQPGATKRVQPVPVHVVDGVPRSFLDVIFDLRDLFGLLLRRPELVATAAGAACMAPFADRVRAKWGAAAGPNDGPALLATQRTAECWLELLDQASAVDRITGIPEDVLGAYFFEAPAIHLYWVVIAVTARMLGVSIEALTVVVLAHELAHAYTHLGRDIDGEWWPTKKLAATDLAIVEGLAQFYTDVVCRDLMTRAPQAHAAYDALLEHQSGPYRAHLDWVRDRERDGEVIRVSMIACRSRGIISEAEFVETVHRHRIDLRLGRRV